MHSRSRFVVSNKRKEQLRTSRICGGEGRERKAPKATDFINMGWGPPQHKVTRRENAKAYQTQKAKAYITVCAQNSFF